MDPRWSKLNILPRVRGLTQPSARVLLEECTFSPQSLPRRVSVKWKETGRERECPHTGCFTQVDSETAHPRHCLRIFVGRGDEVRGSVYLNLKFAISPSIPLCNANFKTKQPARIFDIIKDSTPVASRLVSVGVQNPPCPGCEFRGTSRSLDLSRELRRDRRQKVTSKVSRRKRFVSQHVRPQEKFVIISCRGTSGYDVCIGGRGS